MLFSAGTLAWAEGSIYLMECTLAPPGEYDGFNCAMAMRPVATVTGALRCRDRKLVDRLMKFFYEFVVLNTRDEVLVWLPVWSEVQIVCIWSS